MLLTCVRCHTKTRHVSSSGVQLAHPEENTSSGEVQPRRRLSQKRVQTVNKLLDATIEELTTSGYEGFSVRSVAKRSGVAPATAYTYFASKEHLIAEVFWRRLDAQDFSTRDRRRSPATRATEAVMSFVSVVSEDAHLSSASTIALLSNEMEVSELRLKIGRELHRRLTDAVGDVLGREGIRALELVLGGALIEIGTGHLSYEELPTLIQNTTKLLVGGTKK